MPRHPSGRAVRIALLAALVAAAVTAWALLPVKEVAAGLAGRAREIGPAAAPAFLLAYLGAALLAIPALPITLAAGFAFGAVGGAAVAVPGTALAATCAFLAGRALRGAGRPVLPARLARAAASDGFRLVALLRLSPLTPFALLNFAFGTSRMRARTFLAATAAGGLPNVLAHAAVGALLSDAHALLSGPPESRWLLAAGAALTLLATAGVAPLVARATGAEEAAGASAPDRAAGG